MHPVEVRCRRVWRRALLFPRTRRCYCSAFVPHVAREMMSSLTRFAMRDAILALAVRIVTPGGLHQTSSAASLRHHWRARGRGHRVCGAARDADLSARRRIAPPDPAGDGGRESDAARALEPPPVPGGA